LWILAAGILSFFAAVLFGGSWGPCGPSSIWALIFLLAALVGTPLGAIVSIVGFVIHLRRSVSQPHPESR